MLQELGVADQIVACTHFCPLPLAVRRRLAIGSFSVLDEVKLAATKPDLVITATLVQARGQQRLKDAGYHVLHLDPHRLTDIAENYAELGTIVGCPERGVQLRDHFLDELNSLRQETHNLLPTPYNLKIYMEEWHEPPFVSGNWVPDMVILAGGQPVLSLPGMPSREVSLTELLTVNPDVIIQHVCLPPERDWSVHRQKLANALSARPGWDQLRAVQAGRVIPLNDTPFNTPTQGVLEGIRILQSLFTKIAG